MLNTAVLDRVKSPGIAMVDCPQGRFQYQLPNLYSPDTLLAKNCVLDLASPLYNPGSKGIWYDRSGKNNHGTITGATWGRLPSGLYYLSFDGTDDVVSLSSDPTNKNADYSYSLWAKWGALDDSFAYSERFNAALVLSIGISNDMGGGVNTIKYATAINGSGEKPVADSGIVPTTGRWYHIVATFLYNATVTSRVQNIYVNGVFKATVSPTNVAGTTQGGGNAWELGYYNYMNGSIGLLCTFNKVLSVPEIANKYNQEKVFFGV